MVTASTMTFFFFFSIIYPLLTTGSMPTVGSSSMISFGSCNMLIANDTLLLWPPLCKETNKSPLLIQCNIKNKTNTCLLWGGLYIYRWRKKFLFLSSTHPFSSLLKRNYSIRMKTYRTITVELNKSVIKYDLTKNVLTTFLPNPTSSKNLNLNIKFLIYLENLIFLIYFTYGWNYN